MKASRIRTLCCTKHKHPNGTDGFWSSGQEDTKIGFNAPLTVGNLESCQCEVVYSILLDEIKKEPFQASINGVIFLRLLLSRSMKM